LILLPRFPRFPYESTIEFGVWETNAGLNMFT
jgi:hypothetical protein